MAVNIAFNGLDFATVTDRELALLANEVMQWKDSGYLPAGSLFKQFEAKYFKHLGHISGQLAEHSVNGEVLRRWVKEQGIGSVLHNFADVEGFNDEGPRLCKHCGIEFKYHEFGCITPGHNAHVCSVRT